MLKVGVVIAETFVKKGCLGEKSNFYCGFFTFCIFFAFTECENASLTSLVDLLPEWKPFSLIIFVLKNFNLSWEKDGNYKYLIQ